MKKPHFVRDNMIDWFAIDVANANADAFISNSKQNIQFDSFIIHSLSVRAFDVFTQLLCV